MKKASFPCKDESETKFKTKRREIWFQRVVREYFSTLTLYKYLDDIGPE